MNKIVKKINMKEIRSFTIMIVLVFAFRSTFFESFRIPSGSMIPTLNIGDLIVVNKFSYGFKIPYSDMFTNPIYITKFEPPTRGDVIVFKYPEDTSINFIKRVIGVPGDEIELIKKHVYVNGKILSAELDSSSFTKDFAINFEDYKVNFFKVNNGNREYDIQVTDQEGPKDTLARFTVPPGKYFVMGDNRDFSLDSRFWGFVPQEYIKGKAVMIWLSLTLPFSDEGMTITPSRIGKSIH